MERKNKEEHKTKTTEKLRLILEAVVVVVVIVASGGNGGGNDDRSGSGGGGDKDKKEKNPQLIVILLPSLLPHVYVVLSLSHFFHASRFAVLFKEARFAGKKIYAIRGARCERTQRTIGQPPTTTS